MSVSVSVSVSVIGTSVVCCSDASKYESPTHQKIWERFRDLYGEEMPVMRTKPFLSRRAWKCRLRDLPVSEGEGRYLGRLPALKVSLEVPACSQEFAELIQSRKGEMRRLRKRVRKHLLVTRPQSIA
jgi:hypothetical protein